MKLYFNWRTTELAFFLLLFFTLMNVQKGMAQSVVVNKYQNATGGDIVELLVVQDNADLRNLIVKDFSSSNANDGGGWFQFANTSFWSSLRAGTLIILRQGSSAAADIVSGCSDYTLDIGLSNTTYFSSGGTFDLGSNDMCMIKSGTTSGTANNIHTLRSGSLGAQWTAISSGTKLGTTSTTGTGSFATVDNASSVIGDFNLGTSGVTVATTGITFGSGNNANNTAFINFLRGPVSSAATSIASNSFVANWGSLTGAASYRLDVDDNSDFSSPLASYSDLNVGTVTTYTISVGINPSTTYYYRVRALNATPTTSANSCSQSVVTLASSCSTPTITLVSKTNVSCFNGSNGSIDLTLSHGTPLWNDGNTNTDRTGLSAGTYTVTVTDGSCSATASYTIAQPASLISTAGSNSPVCENATLNLNASASGGTTGYTYTWSGPASYSSSDQNPVIHPATSAYVGTYTVTVQDANGCQSTSTTTVSIGAPLPVSVSIGSGSALCAGTSVTLTATPQNGGSSPAYAWYKNNLLQSSTSSTYSFVPTDGDQVYVQLTSNASCVSGNPALSSIATYTVYPAISLSTSLGSITCNGGSDGSIDLSVSGGSSPFTYLWENSSTNEDRNGLSAGTYSVLVTDANSCTATTSLIVNAPAAIIAGSASSNAPLCSGQMLLLSSTAFSGGTGSLQYNWSGPASFTATGLTAQTTATTSSGGVYTITATDVNSCIQTATVSVTINSAPSPLISGTLNYCTGNTLQLNGSPSGLNSYSWTGPNSYSATSSTWNYTQNFDSLNNSGSVTWTDNSTIANWYSQRTGTGTTIIADAGSGTSGALYSYGTGTSSDRALGSLGSSNAAAGSFAHGILIHNTSGKLISDIKLSYTLEQWRNSTAAAQGLTVYYKITSSPITALTPGNNSGWTAANSALNLVGPITGGSASALNGNSATNRVSASNISIGTVSVADNEYIMIKWEDPDHSGSDHGLSIDDVSLNMTLQPQNISIANVSALRSGTYTLSVSDANGCTASTTTTVAVNNLPTAIVSGGGTVCSGNTLPDVQFDLTGTAPWNLVYSDGNNTITANGIVSSPFVITHAPAGTYTVVSIQDANCNGSGSGSAIVTVNSLPTAVMSGGGMVCSTATLPDITIQLTGTAPWNYTFTDGSNTFNSITNNATDVIHPVTSGNYSLLSVSDANCSGTVSGSATVGFYTTPTATIHGDASICKGSSTSLNIHFAGTGPWLYEYSDGTQTYIDISTNPDISISVSPLVTTTYSLTAMADNFCNGTVSGSAQITVNQPSSSIQSVSACDAYTWFGVSYSLSGTYTHTSLNAANCVHTDSLILIITASSSNTTTTSACASYTWSVNNQTYTASGTYSSVSGCHTENLILTITPNTSNSTTQTACGSYTWSVNNQTYTISGTYSSVSGCHTENLILTITPNTSNSTTQTACGYYSWSVNNQTYTTSGTYSSVSGCHTENLILTITPNTSNTTTQTACGSYSWSVNNQTYTTSGTYSSVSGCHTENLILTITPNTSNTTTQTACGSYSWSVNNQTYTTSGTYSSVSGCHTENLILTITPTTSNTTNTSACASYTWSVNNQTYTASGTYSSVSGCHTENLILTITPTTSNTTTTSACASYIWSVNNQTYTTSGTYSSVSGCHTENLILTITPTTSNTTTTSACASYTWSVNNQTYTTSGTYSSVSGCHTENLILTITPNTSNTTTQTACGSYSWSVNNQTYTTSGTYSSVSGCHTENLILTITPNTSNTTTQTACGSYSWSVNNQTYTTSGTYSSVSGCHTENLNLTIQNVTGSFQTVTSCDTFTWYGNTYTQSGTYTHSQTNMQGCLQIDTLVLTVNHAIHQGGFITRCDSYTWHGTTYTTSGSYTYTSLNANGCTDEEYLYLTINYNTHNSSTVVQCGGYTWHGAAYFSSGTYTYTALNTAGCTFTDSLYLTVNPNTSSNTAVTACDSYTWNGNSYTTTGNYTVTVLNAYGCTHTMNLNLTIYQNTSSSTSATACDFYNWNGLSYTATGVYTNTSVNAAGCTHTATLNLTVNQNTSSDTTVTVCDEYVWNGIHYVTTGNYAQTFVNAAGCTQTTIVHLTVNLSNSVITIHDDCGSYTWNGVTYTASGNYSYTSLNASGCEQTNSLVLTITPNTSSVYPVSACNTYTWPLNGQTYTQSGMYYYVNGCHTDILDLTIHVTTVSTILGVYCDSYTWPCNGVTYTQSGSYVCQSLNENGCLHFTTLNLTINYGSNGTYGGVFCDSFFWSCNQTKYTQSGNYTCTSIDINGCTHTENLSITINQSTASIQNQTANSSYTWPCNGVTYTQSGTYTCTSTNAAGCTHTTTLYLTLLVNTFGSESMTACDSYTWPCNNTVYTVSGTYTCTYLNLSGTTHTQTLYLTINQSTTVYGSETQCDSYTWHGITYTGSGTYTFTDVNGVGCPYTEVLNLTINTSSSSTQNQTACESYTWNGINYNTTGVYTYTSINAGGCTHTATLNLTINYNTLLPTFITACNQYTWYGTVYTTSGTYTRTSVNAGGCTHTENLFLTINQSTSSSNSVTACNTYIWNGTLYLGSGTFTYTSLNTAGCTHTDSLYLTVNYNTATATNATACDTYSFGGNTYTQSGTYVVNGSNASGCLQTDTLHLTIKLSTSHSTPITACDGYYWYGNAYNQSGTYTSTSVNPVGCTHTEILNLVIQNSSTVTETVTACGSYTWLVNNTSYTNSGNYSSVNGCITNELQLTIIQTQNYSTTLTADGCYTWPETGTTYINSGTYSYTTLNTSSGCTETHLLNLTIVPGVKVQCRALLAGPYMGSGLMHDSLRVTGLIPLTEPYSSNPFNRPALPNAMVVPNFETASAALFLNSGNDAIVDWVMLELRQASNPSLIVANKRALIQRDGDIVSHVDGQSPVFFPSIAPGMYYLSIKHRNHVGVMTQNTRLFDPCMTQWIDFSNPLEPVYVQNGISNPPRKSAGAWMLLWSGDANFNKNVKYNGLLNDKDAILNNLGGVGNINLTTYGYRPEDLNMDGKIRYNGSDNDRIIILNNIGTSTPNNIIFQHVPN